MEEESKFSGAPSNGAERGRRRSRRRQATGAVVVEAAGLVVPTPHPLPADAPPSEEVRRRVTELAAVLEQIEGDARIMAQLARSVIAPPTRRVDLAERTSADHIRAARALAGSLMAG